MSFLCFTTNGVLVLAFLFLILCEHCVVVARSFPFLPLLHHHALLVATQALTFRHIDYQINIGGIEVMFKARVMFTAEATKE